MNKNKKDDTRRNKSVRKLFNSDLTNSIHNKNTPFVRAPFYVQLEPRVMFDGAAAVDVVEMVSESDSFIPGPSQSLDTDNQSVDSSQYVSGYDDNAEQSIADALLAEDTLAETFNSSHNQNIVEVSIATEQLIDIDPYVPVNSNDSDNDSLDNANNITSSLITFDILSYEHDVMTTQSDTTLYIEGMGDDSETVSSSSNFVSNELETRTTIDYASAENNNGAKDKQVSELGRELTLIQQNSNQSTTQLVAIDGAVKDSQVLLEAIYHEVTGQLSDNNTDIQAELALRGIEIKYIESEADGMSQLSGFLSQYNNNLDALHILSHGSDGSVQLGNGTLGANNIDSYQLLLEQWQDAFSAQGDIMIYGCDVARSEHGEKFLQKLALLTQTDLAASNNVSGSGLDDNGAGSDWDLEFSIGSVDSSTVLTVSSAANYQYVLADPQWSISGDTSADEGGDAQFTISLTEIIALGQTATIDLSLNNNLTDTGDYADFSTAVNSAIGARTDLSFDGTTLTHTGNGVNMSDLLVTVNIVDDAIVEGVENFDFSIGNPGSTTGLGVDVSVSTVVNTTINDTQGISGVADSASWSLSGETIEYEGFSALYTLSLTGTLKSGETTAIDIGLTDISTNGGDYADFSTAVNTAIGARTDLSFDGTTLTYISDGSPMVNLDILLDINQDNLVEGDEDYSIDIGNVVSSATGQVDIAGPASVLTVIADIEYDQFDGEFWGISTADWVLVGDNTVDEGGVANYTLSLGSDPLQAGETATVEITLNNVVTDSGDYANFIAAVNNAVSTRPDLSFDGTTLTYTSDGTSMSDLVISLAAMDDSLVEGNEDYNVTISNPGSTTLSYASLTPIFGSPVEPGDFFIIISSDQVNTTIADTQGVGGATEVAGWSLLGDTSVDEGGDAIYALSLTSVLGIGDTAALDFSLGDVDTNSSDYADFAAAVNTAISARTDLSFDGTTLVYTGDGSAMTDLVITLSATDDSIVDGPEDYTVGIATNAGASSVSVVISGSDNVTTTINDTQGDGGAPDNASWSVSGDNAVDEGGNASYTIALSNILESGETATIDLGISDIDTTAGDYTDFSTTVTTAIAARTDLSFDGTTLTYTGDGSAMTDLIIDLGMVDDSIVEGNENYSVVLTNADSTTGISVDITTPSITTSINDTQGIGGAADSASWSIAGDTFIFENASAFYQLSLSGTLKSGETTSIDFSLTDLSTNSADHSDFVTAVNTAIGARTDLSFDGTTLTYTSDGSSMTDLSLSLNSNSDNLIEGDEDYSIDIGNVVSSVAGQVDIAGPASVITTIIDVEYDGEDYLFNDATWSLVGDNAVDEGGVANYTLSLTGGVLQAGETATVEIAISDVLTSTSDYADFAATVNSAVSARSDLSFDGTTLTYTGDGTAMTDLVISLTATDEAIVEGNEDYHIAISNAGSTTLSDTSGNGDPDNFIFIHVTNNTVNTVIADTQGVGGPADSASWSITGDTSVDEGANASYTISLAQTLQSAETATVELAIADITTANTDYADLVAAVNSAVSARSDLSFDGTTLTFVSDGNAMTDLVIDLGIVDDNLVEGSEDYSVVLANAGSTTGIPVDITTPSVTTSINDTQGFGGAPDVAGWGLVGDVSVDEGAVATYTVSLTSTLGIGDTAALDFSLSNVDTNSSDYSNFVTAVNTAIGARTDLSFDGTTLVYTGDGSPMTDLVISLTATDDSFVDGSEDYTVSIVTNAGASSVGVVISGSDNVTTTINDTQGAGGSLETASWSITGDNVVDEGGNASYTVSLSNILESGETATIDLGISDIDTNSGDYADFVTAVNTIVGARTDLSFDGTTLTYTGDGNAMTDLVLIIPIGDDPTLEGAENYSINLSNPSSSIAGAVTIAGASSVDTQINDTQGVGGPADSASWSITGDTSVDEGANASYTISLAQTLQSAETATVELAIADITTANTDYADLVAAVNSAVSARSDLSFDGTTLTFVSDGNAMTDLVIDLGIVDDNLVEGSEDYSVVLANAGSTTGIPVDITTPSVTTSINDTQGFGGAPDVAGWGLVGDVSVDEGAVATYTVSLTSTLGIGDTAALDFSLSNVDTNSSDYSNFVTAVNTAIGARTDLSFDGTTLVYTGDGSPMTDLVISLTATDDSFVDGSEDYTVSIVTNAGASSVGVVISGSDNVTTTINDTQGAGGSLETASWSITGDNVVDEGGNASYTVSLSNILESGETATIDLGISDIDTNSGDYADFVTAVNTIVGARTDLSFDGTTLTYTGDGSAMTDLVLIIPIGDDPTLEGAENYSVNISNPSSSIAGAVTIAGASSVDTQINDTQGVGGAADSASWSITGDTSVDEGANASYTISLAQTLQSAETATVELAIADITTANTDYADLVAAVNSAVSARSDLSFDGTTLTFVSDGNAMTDLVIDLGIVDDNLVEGSEDYSVVLANAGSTTGIPVDITTPSVTTSINDTQGFGGAPDVAGWGLVGDVSVDEGAVATYTVSLTSTLGIGDTAALDFSLSNVDTNSSDYSNFVTAVNTAIGARTDLSFDGTTLVYTGDGSPMTDLVISLTATDDSFVDGSEDYTVSIVTNAGASSVGVVISGSDNVTTTINDTQGAGGSLETASWSITGDNVVDEGGNASYTVSLSNILESGETATIDLGISDIDTNSGDYADFVTAVNTIVGARTDLSFDGTTLTYTGDGSAMTDLVLIIPIGDDPTLEGAENYSINLSNPSSSITGAVTIAGASSVDTQINDTQGVGGPADSASWSITGDTSVDEGANASYTISLAQTLQSAETATVELAIADITTANTDYADLVAAVNSAVSARSDLSFDGTTLTFVSDGNAMTDLVIDLGIVDDNLVEGSEDYSVVLANAGSTTGIPVDITTPSVTTSINDTQGFGGAPDVAGWGLVGDVSVDEGAVATYTVSLTSTLGIGDTAALDFSLSNVDTNSSDYSNFVTAVNTAIGARTDLSFDGTTLVYTGDGSPMTDLVISLTATDDSFVDGSEDYTVSIVTNAGASSVGVVISGSDNVTTTINDTQGAGGSLETASWSITGDNVVDEGGNASYTVSLSNILESGETATIDLGISDIDTNSGDYADFVTAVNTIVGARTDLSFDGTTLTYTGDGNAMTDLVLIIPIGDDPTLEGAENYSVNISNPSSSIAGAVTIAGASSVDTQINDTQGVGGAADSASWSISGDTSINEGSQATYTLSLDGLLPINETASIDLVLVGQTTNSSDYADFVTAVNDAVGARSDLTFDGTTLIYTGDGANMTDLVLVLGSVSDSVSEGSEIYNITISNPTLSSGTVVIFGSAIVSTTVNDVVLVDSFDTSSNIFQVEEQMESSSKVSFSGHQDNPSIHFLWDKEYEVDPERQDVISVNRIITFKDFDHDHIQGDDVGLYIGANFPLPTTANYILDTVNDNTYRIDSLYGNGLRGEIIRHGSMGIIRNVAMDEYGAVPFSTAVKAMEIRDSSSPTSSGNLGEINISDDLLFNISHRNDKSSMRDADENHEQRELVKSKLSDQLEEMNAFQKAIKTLENLIG